MPRTGRIAPGSSTGLTAGGVVYHVLNRGNARRMIFHKDADAREGRPPATLVEPSTPHHYNPGPCHGTAGFS